MKKSILGIFVVFLVSFSSCLDESQYEQESIYKEDVLKYFDELSEVTGGELNGVILEFSNSLNFKKVKIYDLRTTEKIISVEITGLEAFQEENKIKAIFFINNGKIVRSNIVTFNHKMRFAQYDEVILSILNMDQSQKLYTGRISVFSPFQKLLMYNIYDSGKLKVNGMTRENTETNEAEKTNGCTDWYLFTTTYYSDGSTKTTADYLYTTCTGGCGGEEASRVGKVNCGGGPWGGGAGGSPAGSAPSFPSGPRNGDVYEFTNTNGEYTKYQFDSQRSIWIVTERILPPAIVIAEPENYPFLIIQWPVHNQKVYGTDLLIYTYDGGSGNWHGKFCIQNQFTTPCLNHTADKILSPYLPNTFNNLIQEIFNKSDEVNLIFTEGPVVGGYGSTGNAIPDGEIFNVTITLNPLTFQGVSQEFVASTIMHECFHAIVNRLSNNSYSSDDQHIALFTKYLDLVAKGLQSAFPGMQLNDAKRLILKGALALEENGTWSTSFVTKILSSSGQTRSQITATKEKYRTMISGTPCN